MEPERCMCEIEFSGKSPLSQSGAAPAGLMCGGGSLPVPVTD